ncbi:hypothetical protein GVX81_10860 [[Haemophilus] felis]|uniref:Uncharacterized protein n=1 Tax=[Haemophilus] felis TaxID=123822 RepID=A0A1T0AR81_9PAST|nr:hypothetical protein [[Haemophilus] felis]NBI41810.1 hypothetical protein [[Haemophilus] felis]NBI43993.1 hypothetical protein [[Haemophilus] felis]OOR98628.1 hypothetical protein B0188_11325 [[Haemophilus] felis]
MKELSKCHLNHIHGGWANFIGGAFAGWAIGETVFNPVRDKVKESLEKQNERLVNDFKNDKDKFAREHFSFHGDI